MGPDPLRFVVVGGSGQVGELFVPLLIGHGTVTVIDLVASPGRTSPAPVLVADAARPDRRVAAALGSADVVLLALPEAVALATVPAVARHASPGTLLVDTCSAKDRLIPALEDLVRSHHLEAASLNPMFAPALGFAGRPVAVVTVRTGPRLEALLGYLSSGGADVVPVEAAEYHRVVATVQAATHAAVLSFGRALAREGADVDALLRLAPPPFVTLMALLSRIVSGEPTVYRDIQAAGEGPARARQSLADALEDITATVERDDPAHFATLVEEIADWLGPHRSDLARRCADMFTQAGPPGG